MGAAQSENRPNMKSHAFLALAIVPPESQLQRASAFRQLVRSTQPYSIAPYQASEICNPMTIPGTNKDRRPSPYRIRLRQRPNGPSVKTGTVQTASASIGMALNRALLVWVAVNAINRGKTRFFEAQSLIFSRNVSLWALRNIAFS